MVNDTLWSEQLLYVHMKARKSHTTAHGFMILTFMIVISLFFLYAAYRMRMVTLTQQLVRERIANTQQMMLIESLLKYGIYMIQTSATFNQLAENDLTNAVQEYDFKRWPLDAGVYHGKLVLRQKHTDFYVDASMKKPQEEVLRASCQLLRKVNAADNTPSWIIKEWLIHERSS